LNVVKSKPVDVGLGVRGGGDVPDFGSQDESGRVAGKFARGTEVPNGRDSSAGRRGNEIVELDVVASAGNERRRYNRTHPEQVGRIDLSADGSGGRLCGSGVPGVKGCGLDRGKLGFLVEARDVEQGSHGADRARESQ
jgi:hypothetical protein